MPVEFALRGLERGDVDRCRSEVPTLTGSRENPGHDLVSMLVHGEATKDMSPLEHLGNLLLLIVGGNDTTRNTMSGSVYGLNTFPDQYDRLIADPGIEENIHEIQATGDFGRFSFEIRGNALPDNPRSSALAAMSVISKLEQETQSICF